MVVVLKRCKYLPFQSWASFLAILAPLLCRQRKSREIRKAAPSSALMLAAITTWVFDEEDDGDDGADEIFVGGETDADDDDDDDDDDGGNEILVGGETNADTKVATGTVVVFVAMIVVVTVSVILGDVEPDVRLYITNPASTENGFVLPFVGI